MTLEPAGSGADPATGLHLLLQVGGVPGTNLPTRVAAAVRDAVQAGRLCPGSRLPSSRSLAADLGVSRGVVVAAYAQLVEEGVLSTRAGSGTRVADLPPTAGRFSPAAQQSARSAGRTSIDLRPGPPDLSTFPRAAWAAAVRDALRALPDSELGYVAPWGTEALRQALSEYLARARGARTSPTSLVVVSGATQALSVLVRVLGAGGHRQLAIESPTDPVRRRALSRHGLRMIDVPVDEEGLDVQALARTSCRAVLVAPADQFAQGTQMSAGRRAALLRWAEERQAVVIEDDCGADFRDKRPPAPCLQGVAPDRVALVGSVSKTLAPGLRLGWVIVPPSLLAGVRATKRDDDFGTDVIGQHALAHLLRSGVYDRHVRGLRSRYKRSRNTLLHALERELPGWRPSGIGAGLHVLLELPAGVDEQTLVAEAASRELLLEGAAEMYGLLRPDPGLVVSHARAPASLLEEGVRRLAEAAHAAQASSRTTRSAASPGAPASATAADYF